jgi:hypothetical protein
VEGLNELVEAAGVNHFIEYGEIAHAELRFILKPGITDKEGAKTAIVDQLWRACSGPLEFICECDREIADHPRANLAPGELGLYTDSRGGWAIFKYRMRFYLCQWIIATLGPVPASDVLSEEAPADFPSTTTIPANWQLRLSRRLCSILARL